MLVHEFLTENKTVIMPQQPYLLDLVSGGLFRLPETEDTDERKVICYASGDKRKIKIGAVGVTKMSISEVF